MKRIAVIVMAALLYAACQKDEPSNLQQPQNSPTQTISLAGTSWMGTYEDSYQGYPAILTWSLDYLTDSTGELYLDLLVANQQQSPLTIAFTYTFDGVGHGTCFADGNKRTDFDLNAADSTITMMLYLNANGGVARLGGITVFHPVNRQPAPAADFPANTRWSVSQEIQSGDTLLTVDFSLEFWDYATGGSLTYRCNGSGLSTVAYWQYDDGSHEGILTVNGVRYGFAYNPEADIITLSYTTVLYGTDLTIGGTLLFYRDGEAMSEARPM